MKKILFFLLFPVVFVAHFVLEICGVCNPAIHNSLFLIIPSGWLTIMHFFKKTP